MLPPIHFEVLASDPARARRFYEAVFGWESTSCPAPREPYSLLETGPTAAALSGAVIQRLGRPPVDVQATNAFVLVMKVPSLDAWLVKVEEAGGRLAFPKSAVPGVGWLAYAKDPEGNIFGMIERDLGAG
jgi:predicted enzyme related to lactoylglutathione lyase